MPPKIPQNLPKLPPKSKIATENPQNHPNIATAIHNRGAGRVEAMAASGRDAEGKGWWASGSDAKDGMAASGSDAKERDGGRAERAVPRRGTIVVSLTQLVPEVLAVWGSD